MQLVHGLCWPHLTFRCRHVKQEKHLRSEPNQIAPLLELGATPRKKLLDRIALGAVFAIGSVVGPYSTSIQHEQASGWVAKLADWIQSVTWSCSQE